MDDYIKRLVRNNGSRIFEVPDKLRQIAKQYEEEEEQLEKARQQLRDFQAQVYKNEELAKMRLAYDRMEKDYYRGFAITEYQAARVKEWIEKHENERHGGYPAYHGASGGGYVYEFGPTAIGTSQRCICWSCRYKAFKEAKGDKKKFEQLCEKYDAIFDFTGDW